MKWVFCGLILLSVVFGAGSGNMASVSNALIGECSKAVELTLTLTGSICLWSGLMKVAEHAKLTDAVSRLLSPITRLLFRGLNQRSQAMRFICMNITANLLGLGNAATPLGIAAMQELAKEQPPEQRHIASDHMVTLVVLNTASIQLLPTTIALLRLQYGAVRPLDILPAILMASLVSVSAGILLCKLLSRWQRTASGALPLHIENRRRSRP